MEFEFYAVIGGLMVACFAVGGAMVANEYSTPLIREIGGFLIPAGWVMLLILVGFGSYEIWKRARDWNLDRRYDSLDRKFDQLNIKERERDLKRREREFKQEEKKKQESYHYESSPIRQPYEPPKTPTAESPKPESAKPQTRVEEKQQPIMSPISDLKKTESAIAQDHKTAKIVSEDEPILHTGGGVPPSLQKKTEDELEKENKVIEPEISLTQTPEKSSTAEEYLNKIKLDRYLRYLRALYESPEHSFEYENQLIKAAQGNTHNRTIAYQSFETLVQYGLINRNQKTKFQGKLKRSSKSVEITPIGLVLMEKAEKENITTWNDFLERYKLEPSKK